MNKFNLYLEKVIKEKEIINEKITSGKENTILTKILNIKFTHELIQNIKSKKITKENKKVINAIIAKNDGIELLIKILEPNNAAEIEEQYNKLCEIFNKSKIHFQSKNDEKFKKEIETVIENGDTNYYKNYDLGTLMSTKEFKNEGKNINSEFRKVSV
jgi:hypothetical protein